MPDPQPIQTSGPGATCPTGAPIYNNGTDLDYIKNFHQFLKTDIPGIQENISQLKRILSQFVCALHYRHNLATDQTFMQLANSAILRLAQCYKIIGDLQKAAGQTAAAQTSYQTAQRYMNAFYQSNGDLNFSVTVNDSSNATEAAIIQMARILDQTYVFGLNSLDAQVIKNDLTFALASDSEKAQLGDHFFSNHLSLNGNYYTCSCGNSAHTYSWDISLDARLIWADNAAPGQVVQKVDQLIEMVRSIPATNTKRGQIYGRILAAIARAYSKTGKYQDAENIFKALLGQGGSLPSNLVITGLAAPSTPGSLSLLGERAWNLFDWSKTVDDVARRVELLNQALAIAQSNNIPKKSEMIISIAWEFVNLGKIMTIPRNDRIAYLNRALQLTNNDPEFVKAVAWIFITIGGDDLLERAIQLSIQYGLIDNIITVLSRRVDMAAGNSEQVLQYLRAMAAVLKATLSPADRQILLDNQGWQEIEASAAQMGINLGNLSSATNGSQLKNRLRLAGILQQIANLSSSQAYADLAAAEYRACEAPLVTAIQGNSPILDNYLDLANVYANMGEAASHSNNTELADICFRRSLAIYRTLLLGPAGINVSDPIFDAYQNILQDINNGSNSVVSRLISKAPALGNALTGEKRLNAQLGYAELAIRIEMKFTGSNLQQIVETRSRLSQLLSQVLSNSQANDVQKARAHAALRQVNYALAEAYIRSGQYDQALAIFKENISSLLANFPTAEPYLGYAQISLLGNLLGLAWAYNEKGDYLQAAAIYQTLLYGQVDESNELKDLLKAVAGLKDALLARLSDVDNSADQLHLTLAENLKAAGGTNNEALLRAALSELDQVAAESEFGQMANLNRAETQIALHICLARQGKIEEAATLIKSAVTNAELAYTLIPSFRSLSALTWALGVRGGFLESKGNVAEAHQDFARAAELYRGLIYDADMAELREGQDLDNLHLTYADLLKASSKGLTGQQKLEALETAAEEYQKVENSLRGQAGLAEVYVMLGEYYLGTDRARSEQYYLDAMNLCEALLTAGELPASIKDRAAILKSVTTLAWALNKLANLTQNLDYARAALGIYRKLLNISGNHLPEINDLELNRVLDFIISNRSALLSPEVLEEAQLSLSGLLMGYIGTLRSVKDFSLALSEAERLLSQIPAQHSLLEERFRLNLMRTIAEIELFDLEDYDQAEAMFSNILAEIESNEFGADDPEINGIRISARRGLADIHLADDEDVDSAIEDLNLALELTGENPTGDNALQAARIHLTLAAIYTEHQENKEQALEEIVIAQSLALNPELSPNDALPIRAQAYYALGEIARLIDEDYGTAASQYQAALTLLTGSNEKNMLAQVHAALAFLRIAEGNFDAAESEVVLAQTSLNDDSSEGLVDMVDSAVTALRRGELSGTAYAQLGFAFQGNTFEGNDPQYNWPINFQLGTQLWQNLHLDLGYSYGPEHSTTYYDSASLEEMPRMSATGHHLNFGVTYDDEIDDFYFKVNPYFAFDIYDYTINGYTHTADYAHIIDTYENDGTYFAATQGLNGELFYRLAPKLQLGLGAGLSVTERSGTLPSQAAELQTTEEFPDVEAPELESDPFLSWYLHPQLRWNGFSLGFRAGDSAYDVSEQAFWPLENRDTMRYAATLGYNNLFTFGKDDKWFLNLNLGSEVGTHLYLTGSEGIGYAVSDDFIPQLIFTQSYFNDFSLDTSSFNLGLGLRINFDLTPGSDD